MDHVGIAVLVFQMSRAWNRGERKILRAKARTASLQGIGGSSQHALLFCSRFLKACRVVGVSKD